MCFYRKSVLCAFLAVFAGLLYPPVHATKRFSFFESLPLSDDDSVGSEQELSANKDLNAIMTRIDALLNKLNAEDIMFSDSFRQRLLIARAELSKSSNILEHSSSFLTYISELENQLKGGFKEKVAKLNPLKKVADKQLLKDLEIKVQGLYEELVFYKDVLDARSVQVLINLLKDMVVSLALKQYDSVSQSTLNKAFETLEYVRLQAQILPVKEEAVAKLISRAYGVDEQVFASVIDELRLHKNLDSYMLLHQQFSRYCLDKTLERVVSNEGVGHHLVSMLKAIPRNRLYKYASILQSFLIGKISITELERKIVRLRNKPFVMVF